MKKVTAANSFKDEVQQEDYATNLWWWPDKWNWNKQFKILELSRGKHFCSCVLAAMHHSASHHQPSKSWDIYNFAAYHQRVRTCDNSLQYIFEGSRHTPVTFLNSPQHTIMCSILNESKRASDLVIHCSRYFDIIHKFTKYYWNKLRYASLQATMY
jgi:hypothetical protein